MSIVTVINRIDNLVHGSNSLETKAVELGLVSSGAKLDDINRAIQNIGKYEGETITPTNQDQTINTEGKYVTGNVIVKGVNYYYTGDEKPSDDMYNDGDLFLIV